MNNNIKNFRNKVGATQIKLAAACGWDHGRGQVRLSNYEIGAREPRLKDMRKIVQQLNELGANCSFDDVFPPEA